MNILKWFSAGSDAAGKVLDGAVRGIDALVYTDEERSAARQKMVDTWIDLQKSLGEETSVRGVTRRFLAFFAFVPYVLLLLSAACLYPGHQAYAQFLVDLAEGKFGWIVLTVVGFYFGPPMIGRMLGKQ
jgi:hypothetical protein